MTSVAMVAVRRRMPANSSKVRNLYRQVKATVAARTLIAEVTRRAPANYRTAAVVPNTSPTLTTTSMIAQMPFLVVSLPFSSATKMGYRIIAVHNAALLPTHQRGNGTPQ